MAKILIEIVIGLIVLTALTNSAFLESPAQQPKAEENEDSSGIEPLDGGESEQYDPVPVQTAGTNLGPRVRRVPLSILMKRALSIFMRMKPNNKYRYTVDPSSSDYVSAVSRDGWRPRGQPLRWG